MELEPVIGVHEGCVNWVVARWCPEDNTAMGSTARTNNPSGALEPKDPYRLHHTDVASQQPPTHSHIQSRRGILIPCLHMGFLKYLIILLVIQHTCELMRYLCHCARWSISFPAGCSWVGWLGHLIFYSPMTKNRAAPAYNICLSFGHLDMMAMS